MGNTGVFNIVDECHIRVLVIRFECLDTFLRYPLHSFLFLLLRVLVEVKHRAPETYDPVLCRAVDSDNLSTMLTNNVELLNMLGFRTALAVDTLLALKLLGDAGVADG